MAGTVKGVKYILILAIFRTFAEGIRIGVGGKDWSELETTIEVLKTTDLKPNVNEIPSCDNILYSYIPQLATSRVTIEGVGSEDVLGDDDDEEPDEDDGDVDFRLTSRSRTARINTLRTANGLTINIPDEMEVPKLKSIRKKAEEQQSRAAAAAAAAAADQEPGPDFEVLPEQEGQEEPVAAAAAAPAVEGQGGGRKTRKRRKKAKRKTRRKKDKLYKMRGGEKNAKCLTDKLDKYLEDFRATGNDMEQLVTNISRPRNKVVDIYKKGEQLQMILNPK